ncbi:MAG: radical SAM protein [Candidatus Bathyarchaeota archaeon]|nr:radical SAM protein [Candidatus Bathyarchaeota archaeon]
MLSYAQPEIQRTRCTKLVREHPCYGADAHFKFGRVHLPVVSGCNIGCNYCVRKYDCVNENRPGVTSKILTAQEAIERVRQAAKSDPRLRVVGISGPGDPLTSDVTFETLQLVQEEFPHLHRCVSTNGLLLPQKVGALKSVGVTALTVTINAVDADVGKKIYSFVQYNNQTLRGKEAFEVLSQNQLEGLYAAAKAGIVVKVNSVYIPGVNSEHLVEVAKIARDLGAYIHNIMPLIPQGKFANIKAPAMEEVKALRYACGDVMVQFHNCVQCRADAVGVPSEESCGKRFTAFQRTEQKTEVP